jgi:hypothetical protein
MLAMVRIGADRRNLREVFWWSVDAGFGITEISARNSRFVLHYISAKISRAIPQFQGARIGAAIEVWPESGAATSTVVSRHRPFVNQKRRAHKRRRAG